MNKDPIEPMLSITTKELKMIIQGLMVVNKMMFDTDHDALRGEVVEKYAQTTEDGI